MQLFEAEGLFWDKVASAELEEDATQWPRQVLTELFRVLPEISEYTPDVKFMKTNEEQGYALGVVVVTNGTNSALAAEGGARTTQQPQALIPIVVKNGRLSPLDTIMAPSGKMFPLTVERLREVLYRPESFELVTDDWGDSTLAALFAPPGGINTGGAGMGGQNAGIQYMTGPGLGGQKMAMLDAISGTVLAPDVQALANVLATDALLSREAVANPAMRVALQKLAGMETVSNDNAAAYERVLDDMYPVDVALLRHVGNATYEVKTASREAGVQRHYELERGPFLKFVGEKLAAEVDRSGSAVAAAASDRAVVVGGATGERPAVVQSPGWYTVFNAITGQSYTGWVIPSLIDASGNQLPIALFTGDQGSIVQDQIVGTSGYGGSEEPSFDPPKGRGCFVIGRSGMDLRATVEVQVKGSTSDGQSTRYNCVDLTGEELTVVLQHGMKAIVAFPSRKELLLPYSAGFISTERPMPELVSKGVDQGLKVASTFLDGRIVVSAMPDSFETYGLRMERLPKLAAAVQQGEVDYDAAVYALCIAGLGAEQAHDVMRKVASKGRCEVRAIDMADRSGADVEKIASRVMEARNMRVNLVKEAAALPDAMTVDAVLSLDFINSENVRTFIAMIPYLEKALNKICELTFASRLGLTEIPETAAARAARGMNDAIRGLKALALRQIEELP